MRFVIKTFQGFEDLLAVELQDLGIRNIKKGRRSVYCSGDPEDLYKANYHLRTALRILVTLSEFSAISPDQLYKAVYSLDWEQWLSYKNTIAVDSVVYSDTFRHSEFVSRKVKDAVVDRLRDKTGLRPSVDIKNPDIRIHIHIQGEQCSVSLDSSGDSLHMRGYRRASWMAPLNEVLAAGMILLSGWTPDKVFIDPMCGSGTLLVEAAMIGKGIPAGFYRKNFCFQKWKDYDQNLFEKIKKAGMVERDYPLVIEGYDISREAVNAAKKNIRQAGLSKDIGIVKTSFQEITCSHEEGIIVSNPPYGERLEETDMTGFYKSLGNKLKHGFPGFQAWILSGNLEAIKHIGLRTSRKLTLYNGPILCKYHRYDIYKGSKKNLIGNC